MGKNIAAVFILCIVMVAALHVGEAFTADYKDCFKKCEKECLDEGQGYTFCEMKCDAECAAKETAGT